MATVKIAITHDSGTLERVDDLVAREVYPNRSRAIQAALEEKLSRMQRRRLASECAKLDLKAEQAMAEEGLGQELDSWPAY